LFGAGSKIEAREARLTNDKALNIRVINGLSRTARIESNAAEDRFRYLEPGLPPARNPHAQFDVTFRKIADR